MGTEHTGQADALLGEIKRQTAGRLTVFLGAAPGVGKTYAMLARARELHRLYYPLFRDLFLDTNPIPVKTALALMSRIGPTFRLPLCEPAEKIREQIIRTLRSLNLL